MIPSLANTVAHSSSNDTVPIKITTSRTRSSSATPTDETNFTKQTIDKQLSSVKAYAWKLTKLHLFTLK